MRRRKSKRSRKSTSRQLLKRIITSIIGAGIILTSLWYDNFLGAFVFMIIMFFCMLEFHDIMSRLGYRGNKVFGIAMGLGLYVISLLNSVGKISPIFYSVALVPLSLYMARINYVYRQDNMLVSISLMFFSWVYIVVPFALLNFVAVKTGQYDMKTIVVLLLCLWVSDSGAFIVGKVIGKNKVFERVSPKKTWEGLIGGLALTGAMAYFITDYHPILSRSQWVIVCSATALAGVFGDLTASSIKRSVNMKDSGKLLPGHGGFIDRFDSFLFASPIYFLSITLILDMDKLV